VKTRNRRILIFAYVAAVGAGAGSFYIPIPRSKLDPGPVVSLRITDRKGLLLREVLSDEGGRCRWMSLDGISPSLIQATLVSEDRRFFAHGGVHAPSILRAVGQNARRGRVISGASTITQQVVRNIWKRPRSLVSKAVEAWLAVRLEHTIGKSEILEQYLNRVPYGNSAFGAEAASRLYFGKPCSQLGPAEAAYLAGIPRSPTTANPYRNPTAALNRQRRILADMADMGFLTREEHERAAAEPLRICARAEKFRAPHFCDYILAGGGVPDPGGKREIRTTLDYGLQDKAEILLSAHLRSLAGKGVSNGALVVLENGTGDVLAMVGSADYFNTRDDGQVNGALSLRQPGSTIKPFTYAAALERGMTAASIIEDSPGAFPTIEGEYEPQNYDRKYHGPARMRSALASSYNVPAVSVLERLGPDVLYRRLKDLGFASLDKPPGFYGLGLTLGNGEVTLLELTRAYSALARGGRYLKERAVLAFVDRNGTGVEASGPARETFAFSRQAAYIVTDILADADARVPSFGYRTPLRLPFPCAAKTGTSKDFRDNWTLGYTPRFTVGVWVGNFDGSPMHQVSGISGCGPLFRDIMMILEGKDLPSAFIEPPGLVRRSVCPQSGDLAGESCPGRIEEVFVAGTEPGRRCRMSHRTGDPPAEVRTAGAKAPTSGEPTIRIIFPRDRGIFKLDPVLRRTYQSIGLKAVMAGAFSGRIEWWINGKKAGTVPVSSSLPWNLVPGSYTIKAVIETGGRTIESRPVRITVVP
jgi:penicillin-binding protein 1C